MTGYRTHRPARPRGDGGGRYRAAARRVAAAVRARAEAGEQCWFHGRPGYEQCPGGFDWTLHPSARWAYTAHHLDRLMHGGVPDPDPARMAPAHRSCNSRDGLAAWNAQRHGPPSPTVTPTVGEDHNSRQW